MKGSLTNCAFRVLLVLNAILIIGSTTNTVYSQNKNFGEWIEFGLDISSNPAIGFNFGYVNYSKPTGGINYFSGYVIGFDGLYGSGKDYSDIVTVGMYPNDVKEEGYYYDHFGLRIGMSAGNAVIPYGIVGYTRAHFVQNRYDRNKILSNSGDYHISFIDNSKSSFDLGAGIKVTPENDSARRLTLGFELSKNRGLSVVFNLSCLSTGCIW